jgi:putative phage-type endonuclease
MTPIVLCGWGEPQHVWLARRRATGAGPSISASDVAGVLGFGAYGTPWEVWADKTGLRPREVAHSQAIALGIALEPWLLAQARHLVTPGEVVDVQHTQARLYARHDAPWRVASPDGIVTGTRKLVEAKTAGLAGGFGTPDGWSTDPPRAPLGYEFQCRWQMHVYDADEVHLVGLVAGLGLVHVVYRRDLALEADMVAQVAEWRQRHLVDLVEPPMGAADYDLVNDVYPTVLDDEVKLDGDLEVSELLAQYYAGHARVKSGERAKREAGAGLKRRIGTARAGRLDGQVVATWDERAGDIAYRDLLIDLYELLGWGDEVDADADAERYRRPPGRALSVKGLPK